ncbi:MAG TPA: MMPL family transporter [Streptosporangiaceae bacterium]|jgi:putative drug exporter of the RND superfamily|nr:MMPL family transporter [Streptosporangiaceae bacterium]
MNVDAIFASIGRFSVRFRWLTALVWIVGAIAAVTYLPSLSSVTQNDNTKFLPASAPVEKATALAAPFGTQNLMPIPVVVTRANGPLTAADTTAIDGLRADLKTVSGISKVINLGDSPLKASTPGQAAQLLALAKQVGTNASAATDLVNGMRAKIAAAGLPAGLSAHLAGSLAVEVDQQKANGNQGGRVQNLSAIFIIILLVLIFRSLTLALTTLIPAFMSVLISGPLVAEAAHHGLQVSPIAQLLMIVLVLGAGTDYGLFLVFRVREQLQVADYDGGPRDVKADGGLGRALLTDLRRPRDPARTAIVTAVTRVGESIAFSAATVIAAVLTLLLATFSFYADLGVPFAIAIVVTLVAGLTLLPALLSIRLSLLGAKRTLFQSVLGRPKLVPWTIQGAGKAGGVWGTVAGRIVRHPLPTLVIGLVFFGALAVGVGGYKAGGFGGSTAPPAGSDSAAGQAALTKYFPQSSANPTNLIFKFSQPVWADPAVLGTTTAKLQASKLFTQVTGPLNPLGVTLTPTQFAELHAALGSAKALPPTPPTGGKIPPQAYELYRATSNYVSPDGRTVLYSVGLAAGDPGSTSAINAVPAIRAQTTAAAVAAHASDSGVAGEAPALYDISSISDSDLKRIIPVAILVIGLLLALVLRSLVAPLYLIASVGVSYLAALGLSVLLFIKLGGSGGLVFFLPFLMFIFLLALGEDYNILVMTRIREEAHKLPLREAVARAVSVTGTTVTSAGMVLAGTFLVLAIVGGTGSGGSSQILDIGIGLALGILMDTFLVRTLLVPSTVVLLGRWNWWPSRVTIDQPDLAAGRPEAIEPQADHIG